MYDDAAQRRVLQRRASVLVRAVRRRFFAPCPRTNKQHPPPTLSLFKTVTALTCGGSSSSGASSSGSSGGGIIIGSAVLGSAAAFAPADFACWQAKRWATKKQGGSTKNKPDSRPKHLGTKMSDGQLAFPGQILVRQRGLKIRAGEGVGVVRTLFFPLVCAQSTGCERVRAGGRAVISAPSGALDWQGKEEVRASNQAAQSPPPPPPPLPLTISCQTGRRPHALRQGRRHDPLHAPR